MKKGANKTFKKSLLATAMVLVAFLGCVVLSMPANTANADNSTTIKPFALYEFEDETNIGKDTSGNGFDLKSAGTVSSAKDGSDGYLSLTGAGGLYAPAIKTGIDFSDYITGSFTVRMVFRSSKKSGAQYLLTTANYTNSFTVVNHEHAFQVVTRNTDFEEERDRNSKIEFQQDVTSWVDLVIVGDAVNEKATAYVNGELKGTVDTKILFSRDPLSGNSGCSYTFCLGMQSNTLGGSVAQKSICDYKKVEIYNCALTATNVNELYSSGAYNGNATVAQGTKYISQISSLDNSQYNFDLTDKRTFDDIVKTLPETLSVTLSDSTTANVKVKWLENSTTSTLKGILMDDAYLNAKQLSYDIQCNNKVVVHYDQDLINISNFKINGTPYTLGDKVTLSKYTLTFKVELSDYVALSGVTYHSVKWGVSEDGIVTINVQTGGAEVYIDALPKSYKVTYYDDEFVLGVSRYTYMGNEVLYQWDKQGYAFAGWFTDESLREEFALSALPYETPTNLNLYAKFVRVSPISVSVVNDDAKGTVSGITAGNYNAGDKLSVTITALDGFVISSVKWNDNEITLGELKTVNLDLTVEETTALEITYAQAQQPIENGCAGNVNSYGLSFVLLAGVCLIKCFKRKAK